MFTSMCREMAVWTDEETTKPIELWGEEDIQAMLEGCKRNKAVYENIAEKWRPLAKKEVLYSAEKKTKKTAN